jgi:hypothetical protein
MSADTVPSSKTNIFQSKLYTLIYCRHFRNYSRCAMFNWSVTVFRRRNVTRRRISNTVLQPRYWGNEADSPEVCRLYNEHDKYICCSLTRFVLRTFMISTITGYNCRTLSVFSKFAGDNTTSIHVILINTKKHFTIIWVKVKILAYL